MNIDEYIQERIITSIRVIENIEKIYKIGIKAYPKTIYSFILKYKTSHFYNYFKESRDFKKQDKHRITKKGINIGLNSLVKENKIKKVSLNDKTSYYVMKDTNICFLYDGVLKQFSNFEGAKEYSNEDFERLANWDDSIDKSLKESIKGNLKYKTRKLPFASKSEEKMINYLIKSKLIDNVGVQNLLLHYDSNYSKNKDYYPDIAILTKDNHIGIIEVKNTNHMTYHLNINKYNALKEYCLQNGYLYMMIDPDNKYLTFEELKTKNINNEVRILVDNWIEENKDTKNCFTRKDVDQWYKEFFENKMSKKSFETQILSLIIQYGLYNRGNKTIFEVYTKPVK